MKKELYGLTSREVEIRRNRGEQGSFVSSVTKSKRKIVRENVCTLFHILNFIIAALLFAVGAYTNMFFLAIILLNIAIGIAQELKAKKLVDELSILNRPTVAVRREGKTIQIPLGEIVKDDIMVLKSGDQIGSDAVVMEGSIEVNESLLTGESDGIIKEKGGELLSGSFVISGQAYARVVKIGQENYVAKLVGEVKEEKQIHSELLSSMKKVTKFTSFFIVPLGILLLIQAFFRGSQWDDAVISSSAALLGMLPKGLVLLISVSLANGVIRLAKMRVLVQNMYALETLAHVDVLCLDKTGTITDGKMHVTKVIPMETGIGNDGEKLIQSYLAACDDNNATFGALEQKFGVKHYYKPIHKISFSSKRKWGAVVLESGESVFVGAPERLLKTTPAFWEKEMEQGKRVVVIGYSRQIWRDETNLPEDIKPLYTVVLEDHIRSNTKKTLDYFYKQGVDIKVISGDHVKTVSMVAKQAGLRRYKDAIDISAMKEPIDFDKICDRYAVFARVTPKQKKELVLALKRNGHQVAMTGDGVNDLLALREADCSIGMSDGSNASKQISQIVLLDSDFTNLPHVLLEGRRVVNHVTRTAGVFFIKTWYSMMVALFCLFANVPFPFIPIQITLIDAFMEAYPSFLTIFEANTKKIVDGFLVTALKKAFPFAFFVTVMVITVTMTHPFTIQENQTVMYIMLILISMFAVIVSCWPLSKLRLFLCSTMIVGTFLALTLFRRLFALSPINSNMLLFIMGMLFGILGILIIFIIVKHWRHEKTIGKV